jgi:hypothetical protein
MCTVVISDFKTYQNFMKHVAVPPYIANCHFTAGSLVNGVWMRGDWAKTSALFRIFEACENATRWALDGASFDCILQCWSESNRSRRTISHPGIGSSQALHLAVLGTVGILGKYYGAHKPPSNHSYMHHIPPFISMSGPL